MNYTKSQIINSLEMRIYSLEKERKRLFDELNDTRIKYENLRCKHQDLCKSYNGLTKKYLKLKKPFSYYQKWEEVKGEKL